MSYNRNRNRAIVAESSDSYLKFLEKKDINFVTFLSSLVFEADETKKDFAYIEHIWQYNDKLYKLAKTYYNDSKLWWIIAHVNQKPTDAHYTPGDLIKIPEPQVLENVIKYLGY
jgi:nucleoid-associated protein YgaU